MTTRRTLVQADPADRLAFCGATDAAAIVCSHMGQPYYRSAWHVWAERHCPEILREDTDRTILDIGIALEPVILRRYVAEQLDADLRLEAGGYVVAPEPYSWLRAQVDGVILDAAGRWVGIAEAKTSRQPHHWTDYDDEDNPIETSPFGYEVQVRAQIGIAQSLGHPVAFADLVALDLLNPRRLHVRTIEHDPEAWAGIVGIVVPWWQRHILGGERPPDDDSEVCERWHMYCRPRPKTSRVMTLDEAAAVDRWRADKAAAEAASKREAASRLAVLAFMDQQRLTQHGGRGAPYVQVQRSGRGMTLRAHRFPTEPDEGEE